MMVLIFEMLFRNHGWIMSLSDGCSELVMKSWLNDVFERSLCAYYEIIMNM
jgi:hypothetical protein